jgi:hypothetical protein
MNASEDRLPLRKRQAGYPQITQMMSTTKVSKATLTRQKLNVAYAKSELGAIATSQKRD